ncbi:RHS repeat domain-containing protein, partial [Micromonospora aurantiaca (nom. illeg.)]|uniref:RHS repeat domain-containing protein n=1 Tax=Micromonospora aurantiaca (nom. illeg.) TaxID=47850 RepID=UPI001656A7F0
GMTDAAGNPWSYAYDLLGRQTSRVDPDAGTTTSTYDDAGQLITTTDSRGEVLARVYDPLSPLEELRDDTTSGALRASYVYDTLAKGQLTSSTRHVGTKTYTTTITGYTALYAPTGTTVTIPAAEGALAGTYTTEATYNPDGSLATTTPPTAGGLPAETLTYSYNDAGLPTALTGATTYVASTTYAWDATVSRRLLGTSGKQVRLTDTRDDSTRRLTTQQVDTESQASAGSFDDKSTTEYGYDQAGNITAIAGKTNGTRDQVECFRYDYLRRLTDAWTEADWTCQNPQRTGADPYRLSWTYDTTGNRRTQTSYSSTGTTTGTYSYPTAGGPNPHRLTQIAYTGETNRTDSYGYDNAGNTTARTVNGTAQTLTWDAEGHVATATQNGQNLSYIYDVDGNRLIRHDSTGATLYLGDTELRLSNGQIDGTRYYELGRGAVAVRTITGLTWLSADHHGTDRLAIDPGNLSVTRRRTLPFGEARGPQPAGWPGEKGFVGGTQDPNGLTHLGAREYDAVAGRFISADPIVDAADPQQWNGYAYGNNAPTTTSDPTGLIPDDCKYFDCYGYDPKGGCKHGCGSTDNVEWGSSHGKSTTRARIRIKGIKAPPPRTQGHRGCPRPSSCQTGEAKKRGPRSEPPLPLELEYTHDDALDPIPYIPKGRSDVYGMGLETQCKTAGCVSGQAVCEWESERCSFQWGAKLIGEARTAYAVDLSYSIYVDGEAVILNRNYGHPEPGTYMFHGAWGAPVPGGRPRGTESRFELKRGSTVRIEFSGTLVLPGGRPATLAGYGTWQL